VRVHTIYTTLRASYLEIVCISAPTNPDVNSTFRLQPYSKRHTAKHSRTNECTDGEFCPVVSVFLSCGSSRIWSAIIMRCSDCRPKDLSQVERNSAPTKQAHWDTETWSTSITAPISAYMAVGTSTNDRDRSLSHCMARVGPSRPW
jgi:hypothetical protein